VDKAGFDEGGQQSLRAGSVREDEPAAGPETQAQRPKLRGCRRANDGVKGAGLQIIRSGWPCDLGQAVYLAGGLIVERQHAWHASAGGQMLGEHNSNAGRTAAQRASQWLPPVNVFINFRNSSHSSLKKWSVTLPSSTL
jgi:hypothetical protein